ncbi:DUF932 domain-containing protein, partial [Escherichia albertii]|uniref:DUF932 domain-containing protein n=1 Tax=Escherichia albertii TaxID=208962 RepID=UPI001F5428D8
MRLASRFGYAANQIRRDRPLTHEELMHHVPGIFGEDKHTSRSQNYTYIPTITVLESLQREGFQPFFACQTRVRDPGRRGLNRPGFPGECFICELRLPDHRFRWKHNKLFLLLPEEYGPAFP